MKTWKVERDVMILSKFRETFTIHAPTHEKALEALDKFINNQEYVELENTSKLLTSVPISKYTPLKVSVEGPIN